MNKLTSLLNLELNKISLTKEENLILKKETALLIKELNNSIKRVKIKAQVFVGGSFAKNTIIKKDKYDIDLFVRFNSSYDEEQISKLIAKIIPKKAQRVHGSRDYFVLKSNNQEINLEFEIIPVLSIKKPEQARNITDLSYFHVKYVVNKIKKIPRLAEEIKLTKAFLHFQECYGAESYIRGISGYAVELLIINFGSFEKFLKGIIKTKQDKKLIIDSERLYSKGQVLRELNEAKLQSPIILIDPTFKDRNALASLSQQTFDKLRDSAQKFLKNPSEDFFVKKDKERDFEGSNNNIVKLEIKTDRQAGDIAGTKLKKFYKFFIDESSRFLDMSGSEFIYDEKHNFAKILINPSSKKEIFFQGPPLIMKEAFEKFKKEHKNIQIKDGKSFAYEKGFSSFKEFLSFFKNNNSNKIKSMGIVSFELV